MVSVKKQVSSWTCFWFWTSAYVCFVQKKAAESINSRLSLVMKSGKYTLGYKSTVKSLRSGKCKWFSVEGQRNSYLNFQPSWLSSPITALLWESLNSNIMLCWLRLEFTTTVEVSFLVSFSVIRSSKLYAPLYTLSSRICAYVAV
jgi:hypothetical protein